MRPEVGFADLVRAIDKLGVSSAEEARAIADLLAVRTTIPQPAAAPAPRQDAPPAEDRDWEHAPQRPPPRNGPAAEPRPVPWDRDERGGGDGEHNDTIYTTELPRRRPGPGDPSRAQPLEIEAQPPAEPLRFSPMIEPGLARAIVSALIGRKEDDGPVDLETAIATIARCKRLQRIPRRKRHTLRFGAQLLVDTGAGMLPYALDVADIERRIADVIGIDRLDTVRFRGPGAPVDRAAPDSDPSRRRSAPRVRIGNRWSEYAYPAPKTPVLALSDLGFAAGGLRLEEEDRWLELAASLAALGSSLIVLTPGPRDRWPARLAGMAMLVQWDRATAHVGRLPMRGRRIVEAPLPSTVHGGDADSISWYATTHRDAYALARLVALTARCEPALLRHLRRTFLPAAEAWVEGELWSSPLSDVRARAGLMLRADVTRVLLESWQNDPSLVEVANEIARAHSGESQLFRMHEELAASVARGLDDAASVLRVRKVLASIAAAIAIEPRQPLVDWTHHVLRRLPRVLEEPVGFQLAVTAGDARGALLGSGLHDPIVLQTATVPADPSQAPVAFDLYSQALDARPYRTIAARREADQLVLDLTMDRSPVTLPVPDTRPVVLTVHRADQAPIVVTLGEEAVSVPWSSGPLDLYALDGRGWRLALGDTSASVEAPWSSIIWIPPPPRFAFGFVATRRAVVVPLEAVSPDSIEPVKIRLAGVTVQTRLLLTDASAKLAILALAEDAAVPPLAKALADAEIGSGVLALELGSAAPPRTVSARVEQDAVIVEDTTDIIVPGMPVVVEGELAGIIGEPVEERGTGVFRLLAIEAIDTAVQRGLDGLAGLSDLATMIGANADWTSVEATASALAQRARVADASLEDFARAGCERRSAALLLWAETGSACAVRHALAALEVATTTLEIEIAVHVLTRLVLAHHVDGPHARRARRRLDQITPTVQDGMLRAHVEKLRAAVKSVEGAHDELKTERFVPVKFYHQGAIDLLRVRLQLRLRVLVIGGGPDGATRLAMASGLHQVAAGYIALAWTFRGDDVERFCAFAAGALGLPSGATMQEVARRAAELDASVLLDRFDRLSDDREDTFDKLRAFVKPFVALRRGRCIFTCRGIIPDLGLGESCEVLSASGFPTDIDFRQHLSASIEYHERQVDDWIRGLVAWGPIAAMAAMLYVVIDTIPRWARELEERISAPFVAALRAWIDQPGRLSEHQRTAISGTKAKGTRIELVGALIASAMTIAEAALDRTGSEVDGLGDALVQIAEALDHVTPSTIQAIVRRAYLGSSYVRDDAAEFVIAFDRPVGNRQKEIIQELGDLTAERIELIDSAFDPDKLGFRVSPVVFRRIRDFWRAGTLRALAGLRLRWFAESNPFPVHNDLQKGHWGGLPERAGRVATATVSKPKGGWYNIRIHVTALPDAPLLRGTVRFHLHDTFPEPVIEVPVRRGVAEFTHNVWGAFTAGIECDRGATQLEIDLADIPEADHKFLDEEFASEPSIAVASYGVDLPLREGLRWMYEPLETRRGGHDSAHVMTLSEAIVHSNGVTASRIEGYIGRHASYAASSIWLVTRGDGRYYAVTDNSRLNARLRDPDDELQDMLVAERLYLRFPLRAGSSFANASCSVHVKDVRFTSVRVRGLTKNTVVYDITQRWAGSQVRLSVAPGVGIVSAIDYQGTSWKLVSYAERNGPAVRPRSRRRAKK